MARLPLASVRKPPRILIKQKWLPAAPYLLKSCPSSCAPHANAAHFLRKVAGERREGHRVAPAGAENELLKAEKITDGHGMAPDWLIAPASNQCAVRTAGPVSLRKSVRNAATTIAAT